MSLFSTYGPMSFHESRITHRSVADFLNRHSRDSLHVVGPELGHFNVPKLLGYLRTCLGPESFLDLREPERIVDRHGIRGLDSLFEVDRLLPRNLAFRNNGTSLCSLRNEILLPFTIRKSWRDFCDTTLGEAALML
jgi:hypothetical protein